MIQGKTARVAIVAGLGISLLAGASAPIVAFATNINNETPSQANKDGVLCAEDLNDYASSEGKLVTPLEPTREGNTLLIPYVEGVSYWSMEDHGSSVGGSPIYGYLHLKKGETMTVQASPRTGYRFADDNEPEWTFEYQELPDPGIQEVTPEAPSRYGRALVLPRVEGIEYKVTYGDNEQTEISGAMTWVFNDVNSAHVVAYAKDGYKLSPDAKHEWTITYDRPEQTTRVFAKPILRNGMTLSIPNVPHVAYFDSYGRKVSGQVDLNQYYVDLDEGGIPVFNAVAEDGYELPYDSGTIRSYVWDYQYQNLFLPGQDSGSIIITPSSPTRDGNTISITPSNTIEYNYIDETGVHTLTDSLQLKKGQFIVVYALSHGQYRVDDSVDYAWYYEYEGSEEDIEVRPAAPTRSGRKSNQIIIPNVEGVVYQDASGKELKGTVTVPTGAKGWKVKAVAKDGYAIAKDAQTEWSFDYITPSNPGGNPGGGTITPEPDDNVTTNPDGSKTTTVKHDDGTVTKITEKGGSATKVEVELSEKAVADGNVTLPVDPDVAASGTPISVKVPSDKTVSVSVPVTDKDETVPNDTVLVAIDKDGKETVQPKTGISGNKLVLGLKGEVTLKAIDRTQAFPDIDPNSWYGKAGVADFVSSRRIVTGVVLPDGTQEFQGDAPTTRGMFVTMLNRLELEPKAEGGSAFSDVSDGDFFAGTAAWGKETGLVEGYDDGTRRFGGWDNVTREQIAVFLMRYADYLGLDTSKRANIDFPDGSETSSWAKDAVSWAVAEGLLLGDDVTHELNPTDGATRAEVATVLMRFVNGLYLG